MVYWDDTIRVEITVNLGITEFSRAASTVVYVCVCSWQGTCFFFRRRQARLQARSFKAICASDQFSNDKTEQYYFPYCLVHFPLILRNLPEIVTIVFRKKATLRRTVTSAFRQFTRTFPQVPKMFERYRQCFDRSRKCSERSRKGCKWYKECFNWCRDWR